MSRFCGEPACDRWQCRWRVLKSIELAVYRWYKPPVRREYRRLGVREFIFRLRFVS